MRVQSPSLAVRAIFAVSLYASGRSIASACSRCREPNRRGCSLEIACRAPQLLPEGLGALGGFGDAAFAGLGVDFSAVLVGAATGASRLSFFSQPWYSAIPC